MNPVQTKSKVIPTPDFAERVKFIVLDANAFIADYWFRSPSFVLLRDFLGKSDTVLVVPRIVIEEVINHHKEEVDRLVTSVHSANRTASRLLRNYGGEKWPEAIQKCNGEDSYENFLTSQLNALKARIPEYADIPHSRIVGRDLRRRRPFQESGKGYRDTLLWESVAKDAVEKGALTVLVTKNTRDFGDPDGKLHTDLMSDIWDKRAEAADVVLCETLATFTDKYIVPFLSDRKDFAVLVEAGKVAGLKLADAADEHIDSLIEALDKDPSVMIYDPSQYEPEVDVIELPHEFEVEQASEVSDDTLLVAFKFRAVVAFTYFLPKDEYITMSDEAISQIAILDRDWNEYVMQVETDSTVEFECRLTFNTTTGEIESFEVEDVKAANDL